jgi:hypothetical protein
MENRIAMAEDTIWRRIGEEIVVIKDDGLSTHVLNKTAAHIWEMCNGNCRSDEIADSLSKCFDVSLEEASVDVKDMIDKLEQLGLLKWVEGVTAR